MATKTQQMQKEKQVDAKLPGPQTIEKNYAQAHDCRTYEFTNKSSKYYETV